jgi:hypothetical protein
VSLLSQQQERIDQLEAAIRKHRDARGHDRCWENDQELYAALGEATPVDPGLPSREEFLTNCARYFEEQSRSK